MLDLFRNNKGGVTIFVTLMLIPAILISGTAVDLARLYTARSILQDSNQMAANAILTQYDALLQDVYGLYAVMEEDPILGEKLNEYIQVSVFGEEWKKTGMGTFQLFYGDPQALKSRLEWKEGQILSNPDVLRRQIEEYAKFRAPAIIMDEIWDRIDKFKTLKKDSEIIQQKIKIDNKLSELEELYLEIKELIESINRYEREEKEIFREINDYLGEIKKELTLLKETRDEIQDLRSSSEESLSKADRIRDLEKKFEEIKLNLKSLVEGGERKQDWEEGDFSDEGNWEEGSWQQTNMVQEGLENFIKRKSSVLDEILRKIDRLVEKSRVADAKKNELRIQVDRLEAELNGGGCSEELKKGLTESPEDGSQKSVIEEYRKLLAYDVHPMAQAFKEKNYLDIKDVRDTIQDVVYGEITDNNDFYWEKAISLRDLKKPPFYYDMSDGVVGLETLAGIQKYRYNPPGHFEVFQSSYFDPTKNGEFYKLLQNMTPGDKNLVEERKKEVANVLGQAQDIFKALTLTPAGAKYYKASQDAAGKGFGHEGNWGDKKSLGKQTGEAMSLIQQLGDLMDNAANKILLLTYDAEMFSNFSTPDPENLREGEDPQLTMSGIPMSREVNYFFQSELEYLYAGNEKSARANIATVVGLVTLIRFVFNYISTFVIKEIEVEITGLSSAAGPFAVLVKELLRLGYAMGESIIDMKQMIGSRPAEGVVLIKTHWDQWTFSLSGLIKSEMKEKLDDIQPKEVPSADKALLTYYIDYLRIFLLFKSGDELAGRTKNLIQWNITNYREGCKANEGTMTSAELFRLDKGHTDFSIESQAELRMLFLSLPFAQRGQGGLVPPKTVQLRVTDHRGY